MAKKIYVSPSDQTENLYAVGKTNEAVQCRKIATALVTALKRCGFEAMTNLTGGMKARVSESNQWGADLHLPVHTNAFNTKVKGTRLMAYDTVGAGYRACQAIMKTLAPITPGSSDSITARPGLYEVKYANAPTAYVEVAFHDNKDEANWIIENINEIAEAICEGVCDYYGYTYVAPAKAPAATPAPAPAKGMYRVFDKDGKQLGAYTVEEYAFDHVKRLLASDGSAKITLSEK